MVQTSKASPPPRARLRKGKAIAVGSVEPLSNSHELRCTAKGRRAEVSLYVHEKPAGPKLEYQAPTTLEDGDLIDEGEFTKVLDAYYIHSPWHDGEYTCLVLTIDCLRKSEESELLTFKDL